MNNTNVNPENVVCKYCQSPHLVVVPAYNEVHHSKLVCKSCGKLQRWLPKPSTVESAKRTLETISLLKRKTLPPKEQAFIESLSDWIRFKRPTPKQTAWLERIAAREGVTV